MIQIKYGCEEFEINNNFPYWNFLKFEHDSEKIEGSFWGLKI
jgi:hypothetical protein